jgi:hypothetical protein
MKRVAIVTVVSLLASVVSAQAMAPAPAPSFKNGTEFTPIKAKKKMHHMSGMKGHNMPGMQEHKGMTGMKRMDGNDKMPGMSRGHHDKMKGMKGM